MKVVKTFFTFFMNYAGTHTIECRRRVALCECISLQFWMSAMLQKLKILFRLNLFQTVTWRFTWSTIIVWLSYFGSLGMWWHFYTTQAVLYITVCLHLFIICSVRISKFWLFKSSFAYIYCDIYILLLTSFICIVMQKSTCFIVNKPRCNHLSSLHIKQPPESQFSNHLHLAVTHSTQRWKK